jgi:aminopeptidase YwaD
VFDCLDWETEGGSITVGNSTLALTPSPYCLGTVASGPLRVLRSVEDLTRTTLIGSIAVLADDLAAEPLTPRAYPFYGSEEHTAILDSLEESRPAAVIAITGRYPELCGALDPFPLIEDGDFPIPTANVRPAEAAPLLSGEGLAASVEIRSKRRPSVARNIVAVRGPQHRRVTVTAHVDTKPGTPGAVDNAAGVVVLLLLADLLAPARHPHLPVGIEFLVVNGEDHFAAPGEVAWLEANAGKLDDVSLMINIDGAGYREGGSAFSLYNVDDEVTAHVKRSFADHGDISEGPAWYQSDHAIFAMQGRAALAITTERVQEMLAVLFHSEHDTPDQVDADRIVSIATALESMLAYWPS